MDNSVKTHAAFAALLTMTDRFESGQGVANIGKRTQLDALSMRLGDQIAKMYVPTTVEWDGDQLMVNRHAQSAVLPILVGQFVRLEQELGKLSCEAPLTETFHVRKAPWAPSDDRLDGDTRELERSATEAEHNVTALRFKLHAARKSTANRIELSKAGLTGFFSWADAWKATKEIMRNLGASLRCEENWARTARRELLLREREIEAADKPIGTTTADGWQLMTEEDSAQQARTNEGRDWSETLPSKAEIPTGGFGSLCEEAARQRVLARCENDHRDSRLNATDDLFDALIG